MSPDLAKATLIFLSRCSVQWHEATAALQVTQALQAEASATQGQIVAPTDGGEPR